MGLASLNPLSLRFFADNFIAPIASRMSELRRMTVGELRREYAEVFGEPTRSFHEEYLVRRIAWRVQANVEGGLPDRARQPALEIAHDADLRTRASVGAERVTVAARSPQRPRRPRGDHEGQGTRGRTAPNAGPSLYRVEVTVGPGGGVKILNTPPPPGFRETFKFGEQNLYTRSKVLVGDRDPRGHEFSIQMRAIDNDRSGEGLGLPVLVALASALLERSTKGGLIVVGALNLGGSLEMIPNAVAIAEVDVEKHASTRLMPVSARRQLNDLPDELWIRISIEFYADGADAFFKSVLD